MLNSMYRGRHRFDLDTEVDDDNGVWKKLAEEPLDEEAVEAELETEHVESPMVAPPVTGDDDGFKKRYGDLRRYMQQKDAEHKREIEDLKRQLNASTTSRMQLPTSEEELDAWAAQFPDVARIVESIAIKKAREQMQEVEQLRSTIEEDRKATAREKAAVKLMQKHPDLAAIREDDEFHKWAATKSAKIRAALYENDTDWESAADAIALFKLETGYGKAAKPETTRRQTTTAPTPRGERTGPSEGPRKKVWKASEVRKLSTAEFEKYEADIDAARREGRFEYDRVGASM